MAVWMQIIGLRESNSIQDEKEKLSKILNKIEVNFDFLKQKKDVKLKKIKWVIDKSKETEFFQITFLDQYLRIYFDNTNYIEFSGSFDLFSLWSRFADIQNSNTTNLVRKIFRDIACEYGISELIYFSEWFYTLEEIKNKEESFENFKKQISNSPKQRKETLFGLEACEYYIEDLNVD